jgi:cell division protein FtsI/penicillin-binding protein 2
MSTGIRFWLIRLAFVGAFAALVANIYILQVREGSMYAQKAQAQQEINTQGQMVRAPIYFTDKNGNDIPAALNKEYPTIYAVPQEIEDPAEAAHELSGIVNIDADTLQARLSKPHDLYELLVNKATDRQVSAVKELHLAGMHIRNVTYRFYPYGPMGAQLLGFLAPAADGTFQGRYGVELQFDKQLHTMGEANNADDSESEQALHLTIDRTIQAEAEHIISDLVSTWHADGGSVLVQDPYTGAIRAMVSVPSFDPNSYADYSLNNFINPIVQLEYEPGSVFKVLTMSAGIDSGAITPDTTYYDSGSVTINGRTIKNWDLKAHGTQTMTNVIEKSLNTGAVFAEKQTGHDVFTSYVKKFGFGEKTGIMLPGELNGDIGNLSGGRDVNYATAAFGQGVAVTPLQMINAFSAVANGGVLMKPLITRDQQPEVIRRVISTETAHKVVGMMVSAVDKNIIAHIPQYAVAGKTGTAYIPDFKNGGYTDNVNNTFIGFAPASHPRFVVLIRMNNPEDAPLAGHTVVPAFKQMAEFLLNYYAVAPDRPNE